MLQRLARCASRFKPSSYTLVKCSINVQNNNNNKQTNGSIFLSNQVIALDALNKLSYLGFFMKIFQN